MLGGADPWVTGYNDGFMGKAQQPTSEWNQELRRLYTQGYQEGAAERAKVNRIIDAPLGNQTANHNEAVREQAYRDMRLK